METISQRWAKFALRLNHKDIPSVALEEAKRFLLDSIGCAFSALNNKDTQATYDYIQDLGYLLGTGSLSPFRYYSRCT